MTHRYTFISEWNDSSSDEKRRTVAWRRSRQKTGSITTRVKEICAGLPSWIQAVFLRNESHAEEPFTLCWRNLPFIASCNSYYNIYIYSQSLTQSLLPKGVRGNTLRDHLRRGDGHLSTVVEAARSHHDSSWWTTRGGLWGLVSMGQDTWIHHQLSPSQVLSPDFSANAMHPICVSSKKERSEKVLHYYLYTLPMIAHWDLSVGCYSDCISMIHNPGPIR